MSTDPINDEILRIKRELAGVHGNDLARIIADARSRQADAVSLPARPCKPRQSDIAKPPLARISDDNPAVAAG